MEIGGGDMWREAAATWCGRAGAADAPATAGAVRPDGDDAAALEGGAQAADGTPAGGRGEEEGGAAEMAAGRVCERAEGGDSDARAANPSQAHRKRSLETFQPLRGMLQGSSSNRGGVSSADTGRVRVVRLANVAAGEEDGRRVKRARRGAGRARMVRWGDGRWLVAEEEGEEEEDDAGAADSDGDRGNRNEAEGEGEGDRGDTDDGATVDSGEEEDRRRGVWECEADIVEAAEARRGYSVAAAWDEGAMIQMMARVRNPTMRWRYGDG